MITSGLCEAIWDRSGFDSSMERAEYDESIGMWRVKSVGMKGEEVEYVCSLRMASCGCRRECGGGGAGD
ncbi:hypothetical protein HanXRQr2_Chr14g0667771 [Helianthus annuus]|uniref:Uncharacterized protein n=1 Tax=Helianthus annuus TaxID=4232 RepID=A0A251SME8_HELAN|nr:hypothetical protein HanXRQr2_Chr14g0667771 [Helianthus annuus]KAJ0471011.1 hypothetical protein HanIR_Chr14g0724971 [Helianthus annuus]KAJ0842360.1 hypothetical protein HanPSC8_Chr14g0640741 [Helianthus annuus]